MKFVEGQSGNPKGRPKGAKGKISQSLKDIIQKATESYTPDAIIEDLNNLSPHHRLQVYCKLVQLILPRPTDDTQKDNIVEVMYVNAPKEHT